MFNIYELFTGRLESEIRSWWCAVFAAVLAVSWYSWLMIKRWSRKALFLPPGPPGLPIVGNLLSIEPQLHHYLARLSQTYGPIFKLKLGSKICVIVSSSELARVVLKDQDAIFANRDIPVAAKALTYGGVDIAWSPSGPHWRKVRKIFVREMTSLASLDACYSLRREEVRKMVKNLHEKVGSPVNIADLMFITALNVITSMLWGGSVLSCSEAEFRLMAEEMVDLLISPNISDFFPALARFDLQGIESKMKKLSLWIDQILESVIASRMNHLEVKDENKDLLQFLLELKHQGNDENLCLSMEEIKALFVDIMLAGTDTSSTMVEWAMTEMLKHRDKSRACEELDTVVGTHNLVEEFHLPKLTYLDAIIRETLRLHTPVPFLIPRRSSKTCCVSGYTVPEGSRILVNVWALQRDPTVWESAEDFVPERFLKEPGNGDFHGHYFSYMPFGSGRRICAGISIAEKMMKYALATLLHSFDWNLPDGVELDMSEKFGLVLKKTTPLVATPSVRLPSLQQYL